MTSGQPPLQRRTLAGRQPADERLQAVQAFERGDHATAVRLLVPLLARTPPEAFLLRLCGMALVRSGSIGAGLPYLARARRLDARDPLAPLWHGIALQAADRAGEAVPALQAAAALAPADPAPHIHLARALLRLDRPDAAVAAARHAATLAPGLAEAWHALRLAELALLTRAPVADPAALAAAWLALGLACLRLDKVSEARAALEQALAADPLQADADAHLAMVEHLCGQPLDAIARLRDLLRREPGHALARLHLATRLTIAGEPDQALALLDGPVPDMRPPSTVHAHWQAQRIEALCRLARWDDAHAALSHFSGAANDAEIMLRWQSLLLARRMGETGAVAAQAGRVAALAADRGAAPLEYRINAHFGLGDWHHRERRHVRAFEHWRHGHALLRPAQPFSRALHEDRLRTIMRTYDRDRLARGPRSSGRDPASVFIVGLPRTGTTLTEHILSAHRAVHGAGERLAVREVLQRLGGSADATVAIAAASGRDAAALDAAATDYLAALHGLAPGAARILDKMPDNAEHLGFIATLLPGARVIVCRRDLRDVGASIFRHGFVGHHPYAHDLADLGWFMAQHERLLQHWRDVLTIPMLEVDHADWIRDFDATLRRVLEFLDLPYDAACARFHQQDRRAVTASREQVAEPVNARGVGRWRAYAEQLAPLLRELPPAAR